MLCAAVEQHAHIAPHLLQLSLAVELNTTPHLRGVLREKLREKTLFILGEYRLRRWRLPLPNGGRCFAGLCPLRFTGSRSRTNRRNLLHIRADAGNSHIVYSLFNNYCQKLGNLSHTPAQGGD